MSEGLDPRHIPPLWQSGGYSLLERLDPRVKLVAMVCASLLAVSLEQLESLLAFTLLCALPLPFLRATRAQLKALLVVVMLTTWGTVLGQAFFYGRLPRTVILTFWEGGQVLGIPIPTLELYLEGVKHGLLQSLRFTGLLLLGAAVSLSTSPERLLLGLTRLRVPYALSFMAVTALRFLPLVSAELQTVLAVRRLRGYRPLRRGIRATVRVELGTFKPVVARALRRASSLAVSLTLRGFDPLVSRTSARELRLGRGEWLGLVGLLGVTIPVVLGRFLFWLYVNELFYHPGLREVYTLVRERL